MLKMLDKYQKNCKYHKFILNNYKIYHIIEYTYKKRPVYAVEVMRV